MTPRTSTAFAARAARTIAALVIACLSAAASATLAAPLPADQKGPVDVRRVTLVVRDIERSLPLYRDALGLTVVYDQLIGGAQDANGKSSPPTIRLVLLRANDDFVGLIGLMQRLNETSPSARRKTASMKAHAGEAILVINAQDLEKRFARIAAVPGITVATPPTPVEYPSPKGGTIPVLFSALWDPDGFYVEINQLRGDAAGATRTPAPLEFTAATYNLRLDTPADGPNAWIHRRDAVRELVRFHGIEILGTQEALINQIRDLEAMPNFARTGVGRDDGKDAGEHSAIFYRSDRFELVAHGDFWLSATPDRPSRSWDSRCCNRLATWAKLRERSTQREFYAFSAHFDHEAEVSRRESAKLMLTKVREIAGATPAVILGDFNATPDSEPIRILSGTLRDGRAESESAPYGPVGTFNGFHIDAPLADRIDYVFLTPRWRVLRYAVLTDTIRGRYPSDHLPVVVRLGID